jgi:hypothetical protein
MRKMEWWVGVGLNVPEDHQQQPWFRDYRAHVDVLEQMPEVASGL